jgi:type VI secretion system secreted protein VgrG
MTSVTQENRLIRIDTPLGEDVLLLTGLHGMEGISFPFSFKLDLASQQDIAFGDIIGQNVTVTIYLADHTPRYLNGVISNFSQFRSGSGDELKTYSATLVPWLWLLSMTSDSRIFQNKTIPQILEQIFNEKGFNDFRFNLNGTYPPRVYCVQYRETDFNFVSRLMEQFGLFYFFEHEDGRHTLVISDYAHAHSDCPNQETARYHSLSSGERPEEDVITAFDKHQEIRAGKVTVNDFNPMTPNTSLKVEAESIHQLGPGDREIYDYPAEFINRSEGESLANIRMQSEELKITTIAGESTCRAFSSGYKFELSDFPISDMDRKSYVLVSVHHEVSESIGGSDSSGSMGYVNSFTCIPFEVPYRPPLLTPKPLISGVQTALVVGPSGEEIYTDDHGRVKVQFHWDREGHHNENSSCWIRVSQVCAGAGWGAIDIPRIGHEVIIDFLEGDPDRPIITGRVYHASNQPPFALPNNGMVSGMKSNSTPGGGGYNEMTLNDTKGHELITVHAQKDMATTVENNRTATIKSGNDAISVDTGTRSVTVKGDTSLTVQAGNRTVSVTGGSCTTEVSGGDFTAQASNAVGLNGQGAGVGIEGTGGRGVVITGTGSEGVSISGTPDFTATSEGEARIWSNNVIVQGDAMITIMSGATSIEVTPASVTINAAGTVEIHGGGSTVTLSGGGVNITGGMVNLNS